MTVYEKGLITILACHALFVAVSVPLALRKVPPNPVYGFRTPFTLSSDDRWYEVNAWFAVRFAALSVVAALGFTGVYLFGDLAPRTYLNASIAALAAPVAISIVLTSGFIRSLR